MRYIWYNPRLQNCINVTIQYIVSVIQLVSGLYLGSICCSLLFLSFEKNKTNFSHTEFHLSAIRQYSGTTITELVSTEKNLPKHWYTSLNFKQEFTKEWEGGKTVALSSKKRKTESCDWAWNWHPSRSPIQCERTLFPASSTSSVAGKTYLPIQTSC